MCAAVCGVCSAVAVANSGDILHCKGVMYAAVVVVSVRVLRWC